LFAQNRVDTARKIQLDRFKGMKIYCNAQMANRQIKKFCAVTAKMSDRIVACIRKQMLDRAALY
jgi:predicted ATPase with chaperone activity